MKLSSLLNQIQPLRVNGHMARRNGDVSRSLNSDPEIASLHSRAQNVRPGGLFVAIQGFSVDGHDFVEPALKNGAAAVVTQKPVDVTAGVPRIEVENSRAALAALATRFYGCPSEKLVVVGITGTNGKTTTSYLIEGILDRAGFKTGVIGTVNYRYNGEVYDNPVTTPESLDLQRILARMLAAGVTHVVVEVSSHALDLHRVDGCWMDIGVFTNLSQDHLDYHKDMAHYWACKKRLFAEILRTGPKRGKTVAVINRDDPKGDELNRIEDLVRITVGEHRDNSVRPEKVDLGLSGIAGRICTPVGSFDFHSPLVGHHNQENILCAAGVGVALKLPLAIIKSGIEGLEKIPGRLEPIPNDHRRFVYVDYAHTPDALENVLSSLTALAERRIICVFGCGGDRDNGKRPLMGEIAGRYSDLSVVTSDNPRSEPPLMIINHILPGVQKSCRRQYLPAELGNGIPEKGYIVEPDRRKAIRLAVSASQPGDTILIAGKGHETYQILGADIIAFDDRSEADQALAAIGARTPETQEPQ